MSEIAEKIGKLSLVDIYSKARNWYQSHSDRIDVDPRFSSWDPILKAHTRSLISSLPAPEQASSLEMQIVLGEINRGTLEWAFGEKEGDFTLGEYARFSGQERTLDSLTPSESQLLDKSPIRQFLFDKWVEKRDNRTS